jgi:Mrp family chromosome partitioning ATPase/capsular polysaccharide biosynthesis protein
LLILLITAAATAGAYGVSRLAPEQYRSSALVLVESRTAVAPAMRTEKELAHSAVVVRLAAGRLGADPDRMADGLQVSGPPDTNVLTVSYDAADPARAQARAQAIADAYVEYRNQGTESSPPVTVVDAADTPDAPTGWPLWLVLAAGALAGLLAGLAAALLRDRFGSRIRSRADVERCTGLTVLATVPRTRRARGPDASVPLLLRAPQAPAAESYRYLRSRLQALLFGGPHEGAVSVLVAGAHEGEGRSTVAANLAVAFAQAGRTVVLVDADLRRPRLQEMFPEPAPERPRPDWTGLDSTESQSLSFVTPRIVAAEEVAPGEGGLTAVLDGRIGLTGALRTTSVPRLRLLAAGPRTAETADLLDGPALADLMRELRRECDVVVLDSAALLSVSDAIGPAALVDRVLLVGNYRRGTRPALLRALAELGEVAAGKVSGVLVDLPASAGGLIPRPRITGQDRQTPAEDRFAVLNGPADGPVPTPAAKPAPASTLYISKAAVPGRPV